MLTVNNLSKTYRSKKGTDCQALKDVSFSLADNGLFFILGKSGCEKRKRIYVINRKGVSDPAHLYVITYLHC